MKNITLAISGMSCSHCLNAVNQALHKVSGIEVKSVQIGRAELSVPEEPGSEAPAKAAIEKAGYKVEGIVTG